jgi:hypothetical protein
MAFLAIAGRSPMIRCGAPVLAIPGSSGDFDRSDAFSPLTEIAVRPTRLLAGRPSLR